MEKKSRKKPRTCVLLGISQCIGIDRILEPAGSDLGQLMHQGRQNGRQRGSPVIGVVVSVQVGMVIHSSDEIHQAMTQTAGTQPVHL